MGFVAIAPDSTEAFVYGSPAPIPTPVPQPVPEPVPPLEDDRPCPECGGSGEVTTVDWVPYGDGDVPLEQTWQCDACEGAGSVSVA